MPLYTVSTKEPLPTSVRESVAMMITDVHCEHTGAPRTFVQVLFAENVPLSPGIDLHIFASVRAGRTLQVNDDVEKDLVQQMSALTSVPIMNMEYLMYGVPASWIMEGGVVLPEPGEEAEWLAKHNHAA